MEMFMVKDAPARQTLAETLRGKLSEKKTELDSAVSEPASLIIQKVDPAVGIEIDAKPGDPVQSGQVVARIFVRTRSAADPLIDRIASAFTYADAPPAPQPLVIDRLD